MSTLVVKIDIYYTIRPFKAVHYTIRPFEAVYYTICPLKPHHMLNRQDTAGALAVHSLVEGGVGRPPEYWGG